MTDEETARRLLDEMQQPFVIDHPRMMVVLSIVEERAIAVLAAALAQARDEEREACAKVAEHEAIRYERDTPRDSEHYDLSIVTTAQDIAAAIRRRDAGGER